VRGRRRLRRLRRPRERVDRAVNRQPAVEPHPRWPRGGRPPVLEITRRSAAACRAAGTPHRVTVAMARAAARAAALHASDTLTAAGRHAQAVCHRQAWFPCPHCVGSRGCEPLHRVRCEPDGLPEHRAAASGGSVRTHGMRAILVRTTT
jgi:hypothetical protein